MGPHAGVDLLNKFLAGCSREILMRGGTVNDQAYPVHYLAQWPHPDRTHALMTGKAQERDVLRSLSASIAALENLDVKTIAIACNTAHAWHQELAAMHDGIELLHIAEVTAKAAAKLALREVGLLATEGTCKAKIYQQYLDVHDIFCHEPDERELDWLMTGIYRGVKAGKLEFAEHCFEKAWTSMQERTGASAFVMGCTEIPIVLAHGGVVDHAALIDPAVELGFELARRAYA
jgi:aspartate racemase